MTAASLRREDRARHLAAPFDLDAATFFSALHDTPLKRLITLIGVRS
jgi:hypothetical protein